MQFSSKQLCWFDDKYQPFSISRNYFEGILVVIFIFIFIFSRNLDPLRVQIISGCLLLKYKSNFRWLIEGKITLSVGVLWRHFDRKKMRFKLCIWKRAEKLNAIWATGGPSKEEQIDRLFTTSEEIHTALRFSVAILTQAISKTKNVCMNYFFNIFSKPQEIRGWRFKTTNQKSA